MAARNSFQVFESPTYSDRRHSRASNFSNLSDNTLSELSPMVMTPPTPPQMPNLRNVMAREPSPSPPELPPRMPARKSRLYSSSLDPVNPDKFKQREPGLLPTLDYEYDTVPGGTANPIRSRRNSMMADSNFISGNVIALDHSNFEEFITPKEKALIYFYNTNAPANRCLENEFSDAADLPVHPNYGFGAVDCSASSDLCSRNQIGQVPTLKLFSNGFELSSLSKPEGFNAAQMQMMMKMTPVLTQPRVEMGKEYIRLSTVDKKKRKHFTFK